MLSSIGRAAIRRVGAGASHQSTNRVIQSVWHLQRVGEPGSADSTSRIPQFSLALRRAYATATTATKPKAKAEPKTRKLATKKKPVKKAAKKKPKKKVAAKAKPKRKALTEEQKAKAALLKQKAELKDLKTKALVPPKTKPANAWSVLFTEYMKEEGKGTSAASVIRDAAAKYKSLTTAELEHFNHIANQNKAANESAYKKWIESHTPEEIRVANNARTLLKKRSAAKGPLARKTSKLQSLVDPRIPKQPSAAWSLFTGTRWNSGDYKGIKLQDAAKQMVEEWKALSPSERKVYEDQHVADRLRYVQEYKTVFGREPAFIQAQQKAKA